MLGPRAEHNISRVAAKLYNGGITSATINEEKAKSILDENVQADLCNRIFKEHRPKVISYIKYYEKEVRLRQIAEKDLPNLIEDERRLDLLSSAIEGGSNYWYNFKGKANEIIDSVTPPTEATTFVDRFFAALKAGHYIPVHDRENDELLGGISMLSIREAEMTMQKESPHHFADILSEDDDSITADVWFQYAIMGEIIYS